MLGSPDGALGRADVGVVRLGPGDLDRARAMFSLLDDVFGADAEELADDYVSGLLARRDFWAVAALVGDEVVGGLTAHELVMTRGEGRELFVYDLAVLPEMQRSGIGRRLIDAVVAGAAADAIEGVFVLADNDDDHALKFYEAIGGRPVPVTMFELGDSS